MRELTEQDLDAMVLGYLAAHGGQSVEQLNSKFFSRRTSHLGYMCVLNSLRRLTDRGHIKPTFGGGREVTERGLGFLNEFSSFQ